MAFEAKRYNMTKHGPITPGYSTMFSGETHLAGGLANILLSSLLVYRVSIKWSSKSGLNSNLWLLLYRPLYLIWGVEVGVGGCVSVCALSVVLYCTVLSFAFYQCKGSTYSYITRHKKYTDTFTLKPSIVLQKYRKSYSGWYKQTETQCL